MTNIKMLLFIINEGCSSIFCNEYPLSRVHRGMKKGNCYSVGNAGKTDLAKEILKEYKINKYLTKFD